MSWPFSKDNPPSTTPNPDPTNAAPEVKPPEKSESDKVAEAIAAALNPIVDKLNKYDARFDELAQNTKKPEPKVQNPTNVSVLEDEDAAFGQRLGPVVLRQLELEARMVKDQIEREYAQEGFGDIWNQYRQEIDRILNGSQLYTQDGQGGVKALRGDPEYVRNVVDMVFGKAARKAGMRFDGKNKKFFLETAGGGDAGAPKSGDDGLTPDQRKVFSRMGVSVADAQKSMSKLTFIK